MIREPQAGIGIAEPASMSVTTQPLTVTLPLPPVEDRSAPRKKKNTRPYLHQVDLFRVLTFACVVASHVVSGSTAPTNVTSNGSLLLFHYTRLGFFALTGFILVYQYANRPFAAGKFWRRRFALVGIPYLAWSVLYWVFSIVLEWTHQLPGGETPSDALWRLARELVLGTSWYQLYFLLVTLQVYLLFPLLLRLLEATRGRHWMVLGISGCFQIACMYVLVHPPVMGPTMGNVWSHVVSVILPYQFYTVLGAIAAWHIDSLGTFLDRYGRGVAVLSVAAIGFAEWEYLRAVHAGMPPFQGTNVFQPHLIPTYLGIIAGLYVAGVWWSRAQDRHRTTARAIRYGADRSFGVFLAHPFVLQLMAPLIIPMVHAMGQVTATALLYVIVLAGSVAVTELIRRLPVSIWLIGKPKAPTHFTGLRRRAAVAVD